MKKMENNFAVSGFVAVDAQVNNFEKASVARFRIHKNLHNINSSISYYK